MPHGYFSSCYSLINTGTFQMVLTSSKCLPISSKEWKIRLAALLILQITQAHILMHIHAHSRL